MTPEERIEQLEAELAASRKVVARLMERNQREVPTQGQFAVQKAFAGLENMVAQRTRDLHVSEARYRALFDHSPDIVLTTDDDFLITAANQVSLRELGEGLVGRHVVELFLPEGWDALRMWLSDDLPASRALELPLEDGRYVSVSGASVPGLTGAVQLVLHDVTGRRELETQLSHARRLAAIGHLAAGVAHEINNPLAVILFRLELLEGREQLGDDLRKQLGVLGQHAQRIAAIVRNLQTFARPGGASRQIFRARDLLTTACEVAAPTLGTTPVHAHIPGWLHLRADRGRVEQVLVNLLTNAVAAMKGGGEIHVSAERDGNDVRWVFQDTGPGVPGHLLDDVFTPFVTGKAAGGSGLGLAIVWSIIEEHGGTIEVHNATNGGAVFEFTLPLGEASSMVEDEEEEVGDWPTDPGRRLVLVVEDEIELLEVIRGFMSQAGHKVVGVSSAEAAVAALRSQSDFDLILTDIRLPGMSGRDLLKHLRGHHPELADRTVLMSGFFNPPRENERFLQKPFTRGQLLELLADVGRF